MSNAKRVNWRNSNTLLSRDNLEKMSEDIHASVSLNDFKESRRIAHDSFSRRETRVSSNNTLLVEGGTSAEIYLHHDGCFATAPTAEWSNNLGFSVSVPAGKYRIRMDSSTGSDSDGFSYVVSRYRDRDKRDPSNTDSLEIVAVGTVAAGDSFGEVDLPNGADYFYISGATGLLHVYRADATVPIGNTIVGNASSENLMPFPYQVDYSASGVEDSVEKSSTIEAVVDTLKFSVGSTIPGVFVSRANSSIKHTNKAITFYLHYGTETRLPPGKYTIGCKIYNSSGKLWAGTKAYAKAQVRWKDGDSLSYYGSSSLQKVSPSEPLTVDAYNGIGSILFAIYVQGDVTDWPANGLWFAPTIALGEQELTESYSKIANTSYYGSCVYRYSGNLLRGATPTIYDGTFKGKEGQTDGGIKIEKLVGGVYRVTGTAQKDVVFQLGKGMTQMHPRGMLRFGGVSAEHGSCNGSARLEIDLYSYALKKTVACALSNADGVVFDSIIDKSYSGDIHGGIGAIGAPRIVITKGTVIDKIVSPFLSPSVIKTFERFKMPVAACGQSPLCYDYFKKGNATYIHSLGSLQIAADVSIPEPTDEMWEHLYQMEESLREIAENHSHSPAEITKDGYFGAIVRADRKNSSRNQSPWTYLLRNSSILPVGYEEDNPADFDTPKEGEIVWFYE